MVRVDERLNVGRGLLVDPGGEEGLGLIDVAGPGRTVIHIHGHLDVLGVLLAGGQILDLLQAGLVGLARGHAAVDGDGAGVRNSAAGGRGVEDLAGGAGAAAEEAGILPVLGIVLRVEHLHEALDFLVVAGVVLVEVADVEQDLSHLVNGVVAALGRGAVAGDAVHIDADLHAAAVTAVDAAVGGLGGDDELDLVARVLGTLEVFVDDGLPAHTVAVLLLHGADDHDLVALGDEAEVLHDLRAVGGGGHAALLVGAAAAVDDLLVLIALIGVVGPVLDVADADGVDVGVERDDLVARAHPADDVAELVELDLIVAKLLHFLGNAVGDALFLAALAGNGDHVAQETGHVRLIALSSLFDRFKIHEKTSVHKFRFVYCNSHFLLLCLYHSISFGKVKQKICKSENFFEKMIAFSFIYGMM